MARIEAKRLLGLVASGEDPADRRANERKALTLAELCDLYLAEGATHKKASTLKADVARVAHHIKPLLGQMRVDKVARADIERVLTDVKPERPQLPHPKRESVVGLGASLPAAVVWRLSVSLYEHAPCIRRIPRIAIRQPGAWH